ncbi:MAG TPA: SigE family RNA polymerase sigma factor [Streptosporangiaceae bacterium]
MDTDFARHPHPATASERQAAARRAVTDLYQAHAVGLIRLALVMLGDRPTAEDVVQEAFCGLYRRWDRLADQAKALTYVRSSVLNGCRTVLRYRGRRHGQTGTAGQEPAGGWQTAESAESSVLVGEEHRAVLAALRRLPARQREALVLRFYLDLPEPEIARAMGVSPGTVKSTTSRALTALGRLVGEA